MCLLLEEGRAKNLKKSNIGLKTRHLSEWIFWIKKEFVFDFGINQLKFRDLKNELDHSCWTPIYHQYTLF